jgi:hypothetical protein
VSLVAVVGASVSATACFSISTALKHRSAEGVPDTTGYAPRKLLRLVAATARHPLYLAALLADVAGLALQVLALHIGALSVVQPLMTTALVFSLIAAHRIARTRISGREVSCAALLGAALVGFLLASGAVDASTHAAQPADRLPAVLAGALTMGLAGACVWLARRLPSGGAAALMGVATGATYACTAALIKSCTNVAASGPVALLTSWQLYVFVVAAGAGLLMAQLAFQAGPLRASLPATATVDPLLSVAIGVWVYDERLNCGPASVAAEVLCLVVLSIAAVVLSRLQVGPDARGEAKHVRSDRAIHTPAP